MSHPSLAAQLTADLQLSRDHGLAHIDQLVAEWTPRIAIPPATIRRYLTHHIHYTLDATCIEAIELFRRYRRRSQPPAPAPHPPLPLIAFTDNLHLHLQPATFLQISHCNSVAATVNPAPALASSTRSPFFTRPSSIAVCIASGIVAAVVFP